VTNDGRFSKEAFIGGFLRKFRGAGAAAAPVFGPHKIPSGFAKDLGADAHQAWQGYREQAHAAGGGAESLLMFPAQYAAEKMMGRDKVRGALWKHVGGRALAADTSAGHFLAKTPVVGKHLFRTKEMIPWKDGLHKEVTRSSALAPLTKARDIAEPIIVGVGLEKGMKHLTKSKDQSDESSAQDQNLREKVASVMLQLHRKNREHEKRAHAERVFWKQVERGIEQPPESYGELQQKLASLVKEDLTVLEKAVELAGGQMKLGELDRTSRDAAQGLSPSEKFQAELLD
jgi:hypothetical protein